MLAWCFSNIVPGSAVLLAGGTFLAGGAFVALAYVEMQWRILRIELGLNYSCREWIESWVLICHAFSCVDLSCIVKSDPSTGSNCVICIYILQCVKAEIASHIKLYCHSILYKTVLFIAKCLIFA